MLRLPTRQSGGKANLHQGAIGVGVDPGHRCHPARHLAEQQDRQAPGHHQRGGRRATAELGRLHEAGGRLRLRVVGPRLHRRGHGSRPGERPADPRTHNARPGLNIQIANDSGLVHRCHAVEARLEELKAKASKSPRKSAYASPSSCSATSSSTRADVLPGVKKPAPAGLFHVSDFNAPRPARSRPAGRAHCTSIPASFTARSCSGRLNGLLSRVCSERSSSVVAAARSARRGISSHRHHNPR